jgi:uncharacterized protein YndB with AHSA1/START domain
MQGDELFVIRGEYREIVPDEELVFTWCCSAFDFREALATVGLKDRDGGTKLSLERCR